MKKESLKTQAYNIIKHKIVTCEYEPNSLINEDILRNEVGVSRTPVRDALSRLEQEGLITILPKKGILVSGLSISDINMIFEVRFLLEPYALRNYAHMLPEETFLGFLNELLSNSENSGSQEYYDFDDRLHKIIVETIPNKFLLHTYDLIQTQNRRYRIMTGQVQTERIADTGREHMELLKACLRRDWEMAAERMTNHLQASKNATFNLLFNYQGRVDTLLNRGNSFLPAV